MPRIVANWKKWTHYLHTWRHETNTPQTFKKVNMLFNVKVIVVHHSLQYCTKQVIEKWTMQNYWNRLCSRSQQRIVVQMQVVNSLTTQWCSIQFTITRTLHILQVYLHEQERLTVKQLYWGVKNQTLQSRNEFIRSIKCPKSPTSRKVITACMQLA